MLPHLTNPGPVDLILWTTYHSLTLSLWTTQNKHGDRDCYIGNDVKPEKANKYVSLLQYKNVPQGTNRRCVFCFLASSRPILHHYKVCDLVNSQH